MIIVDVIRGIKTSQRYELLPSKAVKEAWRKTLEREFNPEWMKSMLFESEQEVIEYIMDNLKEETSEEEREQVIKELENILGKKLL